MPIPPYFDKVLQSAATMLAGFDAAAFRNMLEHRQVALMFDDTDGAEAAATLELALDLLARLYPRIAVVSRGNDPEGRGSALIRAARTINPRIELATTAADDCAAAIVVGNTPSSSRMPTIYAGSDGWLARVSADQPVGSGQSLNPLGASAAACIAAANVFRAVFAAHVPNAALDRNLELSLLDYTTTGGSYNPDLPPEIFIGETFLLGVGAIGHGAVWTLRRLHGLHGTLHLIDDEAYDPSNPQRYVGTAADMAGAAKVESRARVLRDRASECLAVVPHPVTWDSYISNRGNWHLDRVLLALDSAEDRVFAQASLPRRVINSWTQAANIGVSRHDFLTSACVACLYLPDREARNFDELVAESLGFGEADVKMVRRYIDTSLPLDAELLQRIAVSRRLPEDALGEYVGKTILALYDEGVCGGQILRMGGQIGEGAELIEVPAAFQSALAGIMLVAELMIDAGHINRNAVPVRTEINLLRPVRGTLSSPEPKHPGGRCICQDEDYIAAYSAKYGVTAAAAKDAS